jgi:hypothetical protein
MANPPDATAVTVDGYGTVLVESDYDTGVVSVLIPDHQDGEDPPGEPRQLLLIQREAFHLAEALTHHARLVLDAG